MYKHTKTATKGYCGKPKIFWALKSNSAELLTNSALLLT